MKKKIKILIITLCMALIVTNAFAIPNVSNPDNITASQVNTYINKFLSNETSSIFCIGRDKIFYYESFSDDERDYFNLPFSERNLTNDVLSKNQKQINPVNLQMKYIHNPSIYDNAVSTSGLSGSWNNISVTWDAAKGKWQLVDPTNAILFEDSTDDKRGEWTIYLKGTDTTGKPIFDKESIGFAKFKVHKAPIPKFNFTESDTTATLTDAGSYDVDYQYSKNSKKNIASDREYSGIKEFYWSAKIGGNWYDLGTGPSVTFNKNGGLITDYKLTVEDYDGAFTSISKSSLLLEKPLVDFEFKVGGFSGITTAYSYKGNSGFEKLYVNPLITWNDEAYIPGIYTTSGTRTDRWTALNTADTRVGNVLFSTEILQSKFYSITKNAQIPVELEAKNKFDYFDTKTKTALVHTLQVQDLTGTQGYVHDPNCCTTNPCGFMVADKAYIILREDNVSVRKDEISVYVTSPLGNIQLDNIGNSYIAEIPLPDTQNFWDKFDYTFNIFSKRTGELLHKMPGSAFIHTPVTVSGSINGQKDNIEVNVDEPMIITATTNKYSKEVEVRLPVDTTDISSGQEYPANTPINLNRLNETDWKISLNVDEELQEDKNISAEFTTVAYNVRDKAADSVGAKILTCELLNFRVVQVKDFKLESFYKNSDGTYKEVPMNVSSMAIDPLEYYKRGFSVNSLTKGYQFNFKIDSKGFNDNVDTIVIEPRFYAIVDNYRDPQPKEAYWIDSNKKVWRVGEGGHSKYKKIVLTRSNRTITGDTTATWGGSYFIPGTTFLTNYGSSLSNASSGDLKSDIVVAFDIKGYKNDVLKYEYNIKKWTEERMEEKFPYEIGDVIRYGKQSNLDDLTVYRTN